LNEHNLEWHVQELLLELLQNEHRCFKDCFPAILNMHDKD